MPARDTNLVLPGFVPPPPSAALDAEVARMGPARARSPVRQITILVGASLVYAALVLAALSARRDMSLMPKAWMVGAGVAWLCGFVVPIYLALVPRAGSALPRWKAAAFASLVTGIGFVVLGLFVHPTSALSVEYGAERFVHGHACLEIGMATAVVPAVLGLLGLRGALPVGARWCAAALGAGAGGLGGLVLHVHCHVTDALHTGFVHGGVVVLAAIIAALVVPRASDVR